MAKKKGLTREQAKAQTREKILLATVDTLVEEGVPGFSINKVAKRAGIAQPSFYVHFANVDELFEAVTEEAFTRYIEPMQKTLQEILKDIEIDRVKGVLDNMFLLAFDVIRDQQGLVRMIWTEREQTKSPFAHHLRKVDEFLVDGWGEVLIVIGLIPEKERGSVRLKIFMEGCMALLERYVTRWLDGVFDDERQLVNALTGYVMSFWAEEIETFYQAREQRRSE
ncbi:MAG: TetR/AcrR family transcriptional regulator [Ketobacteraceae bacterium]|nr:TetR/AcrR family transcriptional regulator [Ketobacteraceae bacterium]